MSMIDVTDMKSLQDGLPTIKEGDVLSIMWNDGNQEIIAEVMVSSTTGIRTKDLRVLKGKKSYSKIGARGFYENLDTHYYRSIDIKKYPEYIL